MLSSLNDRTIRRLIAFAYAFAVLLTLVGTFVAINWRESPGGLTTFLAMRVTVKNLLVAAIYLAAVAVTFQGFGLTKLTIEMSFRQELVRVIQACMVATLLGLLFHFTSRTATFTKQITLVCLPAGILAVLCGRLVTRVCAARLLHGRRDLIIVGTGPRAFNLYNRILSSNHHDFQVLGFVDSPNGHSVPEIRRQMIGGLHELEDILMKQRVDEVLIALPARSCYMEIQTAIRTCERAGVESKYLSDVFEVSLATPQFEPEAKASVVTLKVVQDDARLLVKRGIDLLGAIVGLLVLGPIMLMITAMIWLTSHGPAIFVQERYGLRKRRFRMYKFRTMVVEAEELQGGLEPQNEFQGSPVFKIRNDPRVTPLGRFLRRTSLDELPQFLNVLMGDMSLVGPRPLPIRDVSRFNDISLMRRFSVKPGITCLWQISGRSDTPFDDWIEMDLKYIDSWSIGLDLRIIGLTLPAVLRGRGAM